VCLCRADLWVVSRERRGTTRSWKRGHVLIVTVRRPRSRKVATNAVRWARLIGFLTGIGLSANPAGRVVLNDFYADSYQIRVFGLTFFKYVRSRKNVSNNVLSVGMDRRTF
jgi:hypothetical protein